jgi:hypothetical protein
MLLLELWYRLKGNFHEHRQFKRHCSASTSGTQPPE